MYFIFSKSVPLLHAILMFSKIKVTYSPNVQDFKFFPDTNYSDYFFPSLLFLLQNVSLIRAKGNTLEVLVMFTWVQKNVHSGETLRTKILSHNKHVLLEEWLTSTGRDRR